jgi:hypothetical protein
MSSQGVQPFTIITTEDSTLNRVQQGVAITVNALQQNPLANIRMITGQTLSNIGVNTINHGLGYPPKTILMTIPDQPSVIWNAQDYNNNAAMTLLLYSSNVCTISIGVC